MTEEFKNEEIKTEQVVTVSSNETCICKNECLKKLEKFCFMTLSVFLGSLLAILLAANILRPKCPMMGQAPMMGHRHPGIEQQMPRPRGEIRHYKNFNQYGDFQNKREFKNKNFNDGDRFQNNKRLERKD